MNRDLATVLGELQATVDAKAYWQRMVLKYDCGGLAECANVAGEAAERNDAHGLKLADEARRIIEGATGVSWAEIERAGL